MYLVCILLDDLSTVHRLAHCLFGSIHKYRHFHLYHFSFFPLFSYGVVLSSDLAHIPVSANQESSFHHMLFAIHLVTCLAAQAVAQTQQRPSHVRLYESFLPSRLAQSLYAQPHYERFFIGGNNASDEYICAVPQAAEVEVLEPPKQNDAEILKGAADLIRLAFGPHQCVWAYELRGMYWTYAFCPGDKIIQFHEAVPPREQLPKDRAEGRHRPENPSTVFVLGRFSPASKDKFLFDNQASPEQFERTMREAVRSYRLVQKKEAPFGHQPAQNVVEQLVMDGSVCDMTGQPRTVEVVYKCQVADWKAPQIVNVEEVRTCHYRMHLHVPLLCNYEPFVPNKNARDSLVEIRCQRVGKEDGHTDTLGLEDLTDRTFDDYLNRTVLRSHAFPVRADNRISLADYRLRALLDGFYVGRRGNRLHSQNSYVNRRDVMLYNGDFLDLASLEEKVRAVFLKNLGKRFFAPMAQLQVILEAKHSFVLWYELYDFKGHMLGIVRAENDLARAGSLRIDLFDAESLESVSSGQSMPSSLWLQVRAPNEKWNFEFFSVSEPLPPGLVMEQKHEVQLNLIARKKTILFQNMGFLPDGKVKLNLQDENGNEIQGKYNDRGEYEFEVELAKGETETFAATVMPDLEYWGYPIIYYDMAEVGANGEQGEDDTVNGKTDFADEELDGADYNHMYHHENYEINVGEPEREVTDEAKEVEHDEL